MKNKVVYAGQVLDEPVFSHKDGGKKYYRVRISCQRMNSRKNKFDNQIEILDPAVGGGELLISLIKS